MHKIYEYIDENRSRFIQELSPLVAQPSISATGEGMESCAKLLAEIMERININTCILPTDGFPIVYGDIQSSQSEKTLLILCHYDVVPPGPTECWPNPPFEPTIRDNRMWGLGAGDAKGQLFASLKALEAWQTVKGDIPVNVRLVFTGDEETGSPTLNSTVQKYEELLGADAVLFTDASTLDVWGPVVYLANRGVLALELIAHGPGASAHSGSYGGLLRNPALRLAQAIASMRDREGRILIKGFYDQLRPLGDLEESLLSVLKLDKEKKLKDLSAPEFWGDPDYSYFETQMYRPTLNIHGLTSGYQDKGWMAVVPSSARAKIDINLVPDLDPNNIKGLIRAHLEENGFQDISITELACIPYASAALPEDDFLQIVSSALKQVWGKEPVIYPSIGGGGDLVLAFKERLGIPSFLMVPLGQPDLNEHSPLESLDLDWFVLGIKFIATLFDKFARGSIESSNI